MNYSSWTKQSSTAANNNNNNHHHPPPPHNNYRPQQTSIMANTILRFPGLARPSNITDGSNSTGSGGGGSGHNRNKLHGSLSSDSSSLKNDKNNKNNPSYSFEQFNASCDDAWNAKIEDKISFSNAEKTTQNSSNNKFNKFGNNQSSIVIKEKQQILSSADHSPIGNVCNGNGETALSSNKKLFDEDSVNHQSTTNVTMLDCGRTNPNETHTKSGDHGGDYNNQHNNKLLNQCGGDPKVVKLKKLLYEDEITDMNQLRTIAWSGIGDEDRPLAWKLLLGYVPAVRSKRSMVFENKKIEYQNLVSQYYFNRPDNDEIYRQIHIDIPRMQPLITIFQQPIVQGIFERILYIWSIRHPASGYVQGMNDLVTPFFVTYLSEFVPGHTFADVESFDVSTLPDDCLAMIEADSYWSFNKLLDSIQDNYTFAQPGIQRLVNLLSKVVSRVDSKLHEHLVNNSVQYLQFAFRWMNNLLIREIPLRCIIRLWDTYLSEGAITSTYVPSTNFNDSIELNSWTMNSSTPFSSAFHLFVCAAFLRFWSKSLLQEQDFQGLMLRLQNLPTFHWSENEVKLLVADAYQLKYFFSPNHLKV